ncbi:MAG: L,D-transpeptidase family protein [Acidithiobacillus sp.]|uniref:L,D-transpeptidase family protein n=1 Tax=Acidithiobacillus sp. TaxID=1872118 RepID=UPI003CFC7B13
MSKAALCWRALWVCAFPALLAGCASQMPQAEVHSVAWYAARIPPPVIPTVSAPTVSVQPAPVPQEVHIVVDTRDRQLRIYKGESLLETFPVAIGFNGAAPRRTRGDDITPVGHYRIGYVRFGTRYGPFMLLTYPNREDARWGLREGIINQRQYDAIITALDRGETPPQNTPLGGYIGIHGMGPQFSDDPDSKVFPGRWTAGCVALSNWDARQLATLVRVGTPVEIVGQVPGYRGSTPAERRPAGLQSVADTPEKHLDDLLASLQHGAAPAPQAARP